MGKAAVYELKKKGEEPSFGWYYYDWPHGSADKGNDCENCFGDDEDEIQLERIQKLHEFNR